MRQELLAETEVSEYDVTRAVQQDVLQLDVAVDDAELKQTNRQTVASKSNKVRDILYRI